MMEANFRTVQHLNPESHDPFDTRQQKSWILNCLRPSQMLKQCAVSQIYTDYNTKNYFINGLLFHDRILKFCNIL